MKRKASYYYFFHLFGITLLTKMPNKRTVIKIKYLIRLVDYVLHSHTRQFKDGWLSVRKVFENLETSKGVRSSIWCFQLFRYIVFLSEGKRWIVYISLLLFGEYVKYDTCINSFRRTTAGRYTCTLETGDCYVLFDPLMSVCFFLICLALSV